MVTIRLRNRLADLSVLERSLETLAERHGLSEQELLSVNLVLEELVVNVVSHGHHDGLEHEITIRLSVTDRELTIEVEDDGRPFNPLEASRPDLDASLDERLVGGLGLHLVRSFVDELSYRREDGKNVTTLVKTRSR